MLGIGWSILCGFVGGWLVLMPWALNVQGGGDWTTVTKVSFGTGLGLLVFCLIGLVFTSMQVVRLLAPPRRSRAAEPAEQQQQQADQESLDRALLQRASPRRTCRPGSAAR
jgi:Flp pilus assembly protein protease CpaA